MTDSARGSADAGPMRYQLLGSSGLRVSELFLGAMAFGDQGDVGAPIDECRRMLDAYAAAGGNVIDTAINYRGGQSETILGELLGADRDRFVLATKYTVTRDPHDPNAAGNHRKNLILSGDQPSTTAHPLIGYSTSYRRGATKASWSGRWPGCRVALVSWKVEAP